MRVLDATRRAYRRGPSIAKLGCRPLVDREGQQRHAIGEGNLESVGDRIGAGRPDGVGELRDRLGVDWDAGEHHPATLRGVPHRGAVAYSRFDVNIRCERLVGGPTSKGGAADSVMTL